MWRMFGICAALTGIFSMTEVVMLSESRPADSDPFAKYTTIMPGRSPDAVAQYPCETDDGHILTDHCYFHLENGPFESINVVYDRVITEIAFNVRPDSLYLGDVLPCWGRPTSVLSDEAGDSNRKTGLIDLFWGRQYSMVVDTSGYSSQLNSLLPISYVSIAGRWQSCHARQ